MWTVFESKKVFKELNFAPKEIQAEYQLWKEVVETSGPFVLQRMPGYRDHSLKGEWLGARSVSLNLKWRVIYLIEKEQVRVLVLRLSAHDYRR